MGIDLACAVNQSNEIAMNLLYCHRVFSSTFQLATSSMRCVSWSKLWSVQLLLIIIEWRDFFRVELVYGRISLWLTKLMDGFYANCYQDGKYNFLLLWFLYHKRLDSLHGCKWQVNWSIARLALSVNMKLFIATEHKHIDTHRVHMSEEPPEMNNQWKHHTNRRDCTFIFWVTMHSEWHSYLPFSTAVSFVPFLWTS